MAVDMEQVDALRGALGGSLVLPGDAEYEQRRGVWNGNIDRRPALIVRCSGVADVVAALNFARSQGLPIAVRGGAHNAAGHATCDDGIVIDLSGLKGIRVDPEARTATAQPGVTWAELDRESQLFGLATTGGTVSNTGIAGLTLGGGIGWLHGVHGFTCDNLLGADVVLADGSFVRASATENPDLFWALRGGGGNFGIVTSFEYRLHSVGPIVLGGLVLHPLDKAREVLAFYRDFSSSDLPDAAECYAAMVSTPDGIKVVALILGYNGDLDEGEKVLEPARKFGQPIADLVQRMPYSARQSMMDEGLTTHGVQRYWKSGIVEDLSDELIDKLVRGAETFPNAMALMPMFRLHGAATRVPTDATAFAVRRPVWDVNAISQWTDAAEGERNIAWVRDLWAGVEPHTTGGAYINHLSGDDRAEKLRASYGDNYARLAQIKAKYDPQNIFRLNPNVRPA